jgi:hypothetical protein
MTTLNRDQIARDAFWDASWFSGELALLDIADLHGVNTVRALEMLQNGECEHNSLGLERAIELVNELSDEQLFAYNDLGMFESM